MVLALAAVVALSVIVLAALTDRSGAWDHRGTTSTAAGSTAALLGPSN
jgi:hypothetical protein